MKSGHLRVYPVVDTAGRLAAPHAQIVSFVFPELVDFFDVLAYYLRIAGVAQG